MINKSSADRTTAPTQDSQPLVEQLLAPFRDFASTASSGVIVLLAATAVSLIWANSPWSESYHHVWETRLSLGAGAWSVQLTLHDLINVGLMAVFLFVVGLEIKRQLWAGELKSLRAAALPLIAALGGMVIPAALYALMNFGGPGGAYRWRPTSPSHSECSRCSA